MAALHAVEGWFRLAREAGRQVRLGELTPLCRLAMADALHFVAHAARRGDLARMPRTADIAGFVTDHLPLLARLLPLCDL